MSDRLNEIRGLAARAQANPEIAADVAGAIADLLELDAARDPFGGFLPEDYVAAGVQRLVVRFDRLEPEPPESTLPPYRTSQDGSTPLRFPYDVLVLGVSAVVRPVPIFDPETGEPLIPIQATLSSSDELRDLVAASWQIDGSETRQTNGQQSRLVPLSCITGTGAEPMPYADRYRRSQSLVVKARNLTNFTTLDSEAIADPTGVLRNGFPVSVEVCFHSLALDGP